MTRSALFERAELLELVNEARRAPSVHNIQPARWAAVAPGVLALRADPRRTLPIADASGHDVRVSLGAAWEGMAIALSKRGWVVAAPSLDGRGEKAPFETRLAYERGGDTDPLAEAVARRAAWRGTFAPTPDATLDALEPTMHAVGVVVVRDRARIRELAALADQANGEFLMDPRYWRETWRWIRLSHRHPDWDRDGLNADGLALSGVERMMGQWLMAPATFEVMGRIGLARAFLSEHGKVVSAGALLLLTAPADEDPFLTGRAFYRRWLEVTAAGLALCPMSVLADSRRANAQIRAMFSLPDRVRLVNVFRIGAPPPGFPRRLTPRLPAEELIDPPFA